MLGRWDSGLAYVPASASRHRCCAGCGRTSCSWASMAGRPGLLAGWCCQLGRMWTPCSCTSLAAAGKWKGRGVAGACEPSTALPGCWGAQGRSRHFCTCSMRRHSGVGIPGWLGGDKCCAWTSCQDGGCMSDAVQSCAGPMDWPWQCGSISEQWWLWCRGMLSPLGREGEVKCQPVPTNRPKWAE